MENKSEQPKICPLMFKTKPTDDGYIIYAKCQGDKCALWVEDKKAFAGKYRSEYVVETPAHCGLIRS